MIWELIFLGSWHCEFAAGREARSHDEEVEIRCKYFSEERGGFTSMYKAELGPQGAWELSGRPEEGSVRSRVSAGACRRERHLGRGRSPHFAP